MPSGHPTNINSDAKSTRNNGARKNVDTKTTQDRNRMHEKDTCHNTGGFDGKTGKPADLPPKLYEQCYGTVTSVQNPHGGNGADTVDIEGVKAPKAATGPKQGSKPQNDPDISTKLYTVLGSASNSASKSNDEGSSDRNRERGSANGETAKNNSESLNSEADSSQKAGNEERSASGPNGNPSHQDGGSLNFKNSNRSRSASLECTSRYTYVPHEDKVWLTSPAKRSSLENTPNTMNAALETEFRRERGIHKCRKQRGKSGPTTINILLLGETGVGKTTFVNSLLNNLEHKSLKTILDAESAMPRLLVDTAFTLSDEHHQIIRVKFKANYTNSDQYDAGSTNERLNDKGDSATQGPVVHNITWEDTTGKTKLLRIIDTPGMSDTHGMKQDDENFEKILRCINKLGELHAICIVMKPNQARFSLSFRYNIESFLTRLHRDAIKNILFCFTNTRSTLYRPGDTLATLHSYLATLEKEKGILIKADKHNIFCFDNDCFRYVLAVKHGAYERTNELDTLFSESWERNVSESKKLLERAECLPIHSVQDTLNINRTQQLVTILAKPLAEIARNHLLNMRLTEDYIKQIKGLKGQQSNLQSSIKKTVVVLEPKKLCKPRTVCMKCTKWHEFHYESIPDYKVCHNQCNLERSPQTGSCVAFYHKGQYTSYCVVCGCHRNHHDHQLYQYEIRTHEVVDRRAQYEYHDVAQRAENVKKLLEEENEKYKSLEFEHDSIRDFCAEAAVFLMENAIKSTGDPYLLQIQNLIRDEKSKVTHGGGNQDMCYELEALLERYEKRVESLQKDIRENRRTPVTCDELFHKMDILALQPHCGAQVKQLKAICEENIREQEEKAKMEENAKNLLP